MSDGLPIRIDLAHGRAFVAGTVLAAEAVEGNLRFDGPDGPVLRALSFGDRMGAVDRALEALQPRDAVAAEVLFAARLAPGTLDPAIQEVLAMYLAGAGTEAPPFRDTIVTVARATGWTYAQIAATEAAVIDRLAEPAAGPDGSGWNVLLLGCGDSEGLEALRLRLADDLLRRAETVEEEHSEDTRPIPDDCEPVDSAPAFRSNRAAPASEPVQPIDRAPSPERPAQAAPTSPALGAPAPPRSTPHDAPVLPKFRTSLPSTAARSGQSQTKGAAPALPLIRWRMANRLAAGPAVLAPAPAETLADMPQFAAAPSSAPAPRSAVPAPVEMELPDLPTAPSPQRSRPGDSTEPLLLISVLEDLAALLDEEADLRGIDR